MEEEQKPEQGEEEPLLHEPRAVYGAGAEMVTLSFEVPRWAFATLRLSPREYVRGMQEAAVAHWYDQRLVSQARAAELLGISRGEFLDLLFRNGVSPFQYEGEDELAQEAKRGYTLG